MKAEAPARLLLPPTLKVSGKGGSQGRSRGRAEAPPELDAAAMAVFEALRAHRLEVAKAEGVPPYVVASDRSLRDVALLRPRTLDELKMAHGIGPAKAEKYGAGLLEVVAQRPRK